MGPKSMKNFRKSPERNSDIHMADRRVGTRAKAEGVNNTPLATPDFEQFVQLFAMFLFAKMFLESSIGQNGLYRSP